jgi:peptidoglycan/LPS O-acetylase OafA/YrhL
MKGIKAKCLTGVEMVRNAQGAPGLLLSNESERLQTVDGLRGVAILLVVGFHFFSAHQDLFPYGAVFSNVLLFKYGFTGVDLFFIISGFVIALTLERCRSPFDFLLRRVIRIWPALVVSAIIVFVLLNVSPSPSAQQHRPSWEDFIPSLTLTPSVLWQGIFPKIDHINSVYWTLVIETQFYVIAAAIFWLCGQEQFSRNLAIFTFANILVRAAVKRLLPEFAMITYQTMQVTDFMPWFAAGAIFFDLFKKRLTKVTAVILLGAMFLIIVRTAAFNSEPFGIILFALAFFSAFWLISIRHRAGNAFVYRPLVWVGAASYSIYLYHEPLGMVLISSVPKSLSIGFQVTIVLLITALMLLIGYLSFKMVEMPSARALKRAWLKPGTTNVGTFPGSPDRSGPPSHL